MTAICKIGLADWVICRKSN